MTLRKISPLLVALALLGCSKPLRSSGSEPTAPPKEVASANQGLKARTSPLTVGKAVPDFQLVDQSGRGVSSGELTSGKGAVVVFLPPIGSPGARPAFEWAKRNQALLTQRRLEVLLVVPDSVATNAAVARSEGLRLAVLSDPKAWVAQAFGVVPKGGHSVAKPWVTVLGSDGRVQYLKAGLADASELIMAAESKPGTPRGGVTDFL